MCNELRITFIWKSAHYLWFVCSMIETLQLKASFHSSERPVPLGPDARIPLLFHLAYVHLLSTLWRKKPLICIYWVKISRIKQSFGNVFECFGLIGWFVFVFASWHNQTLSRMLYVQSLLRIFLIGSCERLRWHLQFDFRCTSIKLLCHVCRLPFILISIISSMVLFQQVGCVTIRYSSYTVPESSYNLHYRKVFWETRSSSHFGHFDTFMSFGPINPRDPIF